jgi:DNA-directed RNA polymerase specialized sigma24 family protein
MTDVGLTDAELSRRFLDYADHTALEELFERHRGLAYRTAWGVLQSTADAEDAVQEAFIALIRYAPRMRCEGSLAPYSPRFHWGE